MRRVVVVLAVVLSGCATSRPTGFGTGASRIFDGPPERIWAAIETAVAAQPYVRRSSDVEQGWLVIERTYPASAVASYTRDAAARLPGKWWGLEVTMFVTTHPRPSGQIDVAADARIMGRGSPSEPTVTRAGFTIMPLQSNGTLERELLDDVDKALHRRVLRTAPAPH